MLVAQFWNLYACRFELPWNVGCEICCILRPVFLLPGWLLALLPGCLQPEVARSHAPAPRLALKLLCSPAPKLVNSVSMAMPPPARLPGGALAAFLLGAPRLASALPHRGGGPGVPAGTCVRKACGACALGVAAHRARLRHGTGGKSESSARYTYHSDVVARSHANLIMAQPDSAQESHAGDEPRCCCVCTEPLEWVAVGRCGHRDVCAGCATRIRFFRHDQRCCICRTVLVTRADGGASGSSRQQGFVHPTRLPRPVARVAGRAPTGTMVPRGPTSTTGARTGRRSSCA